MRVLSSVIKGKKTSRTIWRSSYTSFAPSAASCWVSVVSKLMTCTKRCVVLSLFLKSGANWSLKAVRTQIRISAINAIGSKGSFLPQTWNHTLYNKIKDTKFKCENEFKLCVEFVLEALRSSFDFHVPRKHAKKSSAFVAIENNVVNIISITKGMQSLM